MKFKPELKPELTQTNGFVEVLILGKEYFGKVSNSNYLQTERSSRWSGWRDLNSRHPAPKAGALPDCATPRKEE